ncbi:guanylate cyclase [Polaromonas sp.]|uniref:guanylate cyclase n=1 Tax=Polaromonas sp. TaxID=1869339 RepID=UPI0013BD93F3|nr:guanylate cyclase [Polaromonas sp.]NDP62180.1 guanylate cyclase [Polaromonas sp.]
MALQEHQQELDQQLAQFHRAFECGGLHGALHYLNARTSFRYTAIYRLDGQMMRNIFLYDRQGENPTSLSEVPLGDSFCQFVLRDNGFNTANSANDVRLLGNPYQGVLNSYYGLPLSRKAGTIYGTFCHFDVLPMEIPDSEIALLEAVSPMLMDQLD